MWPVALESPFNNSMLCLEVTRISSAYNLGTACHETPCHHREAARPVLSRGFTRRGGHLINGSCGQHASSASTALPWDLPSPHSASSYRKPSGPAVCFDFAPFLAWPRRADRLNLAGADPKDARVAFFLKEKKKKTWKCKVNTNKWRQLRRPTAGGSGSMRRCPRSGRALSGPRICQRL